MRLAFPFALALLVSATACHEAPPANGLDAIDDDLVNGATADEHSANGALGGAIHVDPAKTGHQPGDRAVDIRVAPVTKDGEGSMVEGGSGCLGGLVYSNGWAAKLPADLPMHPAAKLEEAAGHDGGCRARIVSFAVPGDRGQVLGWYRARARAAGYSTDRADKGDDWILAGDKGSSAYTIIFGAPRHGATPVDYVWTSGG